MNLYLLLFASVLFSIFKSIFQNQYAKKMQRDDTDLLIFNLYLSLGSLTGLIVNAKFRINITAKLLIAAAFFGLLSALSYFYSTKALRLGSMSYTVFIGSTAMLIPIIAATLIWKDPISPFQIIGIILLVLSFYLGLDFKEKAKISKGWIIACGIMFISSGMIGVMQKYQQGSSFKDETASFLALGFIFASIFIAIPLLFSKNKANILSFGLKGFSYAFISGLLYAFVNVANIYLVGKMISALFFPLFNGSVILMTTAAGALVFKEKLTRGQYISMAVGIIGIILVNI